MELQKEMKAWLGFGSAVARLLSGEREGEISTEDGVDIKRVIGRSYDQWANGALPFWNWGMFDETVHEEIARTLEGYDQHDSDGHSEQLYFSTLAQVPNREGRACAILEVGSGAGAGLNFLSRLESQSVFTGVDLAEQAVARANARYARRDALSFVHGDAEQLPFEDAAFDVVINVESAHNYPRLGTFFNEVARVLKPGGHFSIVDFFSEERWREMQRCKAAAGGLQWLSERDITEPVKAAIRRRMKPNSAFRRTVRDPAPFPARWLLEHNALIQYGSPFASPEDLVSRLTSRLTDGLRAVSNLSSYRLSLAAKR